ncbi:MAG: glutamate 5-kinase [Chloroflexi bacterium HGW-Chloroflexi-5]|jgi:glutamate 5-kinase|nr:MAG: glutamate 5-kinase [Chloroflexi bacterium HGW-Chloroflexi-5]
MASQQRIVIKIGTSTLTAGSKKLNPAQMVDLARQCATLHAQKYQVVLVSSGAMAAGREELGYPTLPKGVPAKQMLAAVGQPRLMAMYEQFFGIYKVHVAQVLLTRADLADRHGYLNARATLEALLDQGIIPIVNENDTIATEEIRIGDNDNLSAQVANLIEADLLILLTDQDGLYTSDPRSNKNAKLITEVGPEPFSKELWQSAGGSDSGLGIGGMTTKLQAADLARHGGTEVIIARGSVENILMRLTSGEISGTKLLPVVNKLEGRKRRILSGSHTKCEVVIDTGAVQALSRGGSLLPAGVTQLKGSFERGDAVKVVTADKKSVAVGLTNYSTADLQKICGKQSTEIESELGFTFGDEVIHRDHMVLL